MNRLVFLECEIHGIPHAAGRLMAHLKRDGYQYIRFVNDGSVTSKVCLGLPYGFETRVIGPARLILWRMTHYCETGRMSDGRRLVVRTLIVAVMEFLRSERF